MPSTLFQEADTEVERDQNQKPVWIGLIIVLFVFVILETIIAIKTPAYESADEPGHVQNIQTLLQGHWYGMKLPCQLNPHIGLLQCSGDEAQQAPLYYILFAGWQWLIGKPALPPFNHFHVVINPAFFLGSSGIFLHHPQAQLDFLLWLRLPNIGLGVLTIITIFFSIRLITMDRWTPLVAASFVAFLPRMMFLWPFVTNDNLVNLGGAVFLYLCLRFILKPRLQGIGLIGVVMGMLVITKTSTLPLVIVVIGLALLGTTWKRRFEFLAVGLGGALLVSGWYLVQNMVRYGDPLARRATAHYLTVLGAPGAPSGQLHGIPEFLKFVFVQVPQRFNNTFWYLSGWNQFHWTWWVNLLFTCGLIASLVGLIGRHVDRKILLTLISIWIAAALCVWGVALQAYNVPTAGGWQARYAFVGIGALAGLVSLGVERWKTSLRFLLPAMGLIGAVAAIQMNVLSVNWS